MSDRTLAETIGFSSQSLDRDTNRSDLLRHIKLKLIANGQSVPTSGIDEDLSGADRLLMTYYQRLKQLDAVRCPVDRRIEGFLQKHFGGIAGGSALRVPYSTLALDRHGIARELSLPVNGDEFHLSLIHI